MFQNKYDIDNKHLHSLEELEKDGRIQMGRGNVISKQDMQQCPGDYPVYSSAANNNGLIGTYGNYMFDDERLTWSIDGGGRWFYRNGEKYSVTNVGGWLKVLDPNINTRYLYHALSSQWVKKEYDYIHKALPSIIKDDYIVPIPPLAVQEEIVQILDKFTELKAELKAELEARKKQYEWYRDRLLSFDEGVKRVKIKSIAEVGTGSSNGNEAEVNGKYPFYIRSQTIKQKNKYEFDEEAIIIPGEGGIGDIFHYINGKYALHQRAYRIHFTHPEISARFVFYYMKANFKKFIMGKAVSATVSSIRKPMIEDFEISMPPIEEQRRIVSILDRLDTLCNDISTGLPAEIAARRKQYEYYRDKLLSFEEVA